MKGLLRSNLAFLPVSIFILSISFAQYSGPNLTELDQPEYYTGIQETAQDTLIQWQERVILHIANENIDSDDLLFFKGYLLTGVEQDRYSLSSVLNLELLNDRGEVVKSQYHKVADGMVEGNLEFPKNIRPGKYYLRAYTRWMQNYGVELYAKKHIWVGRPSNKSASHIGTSNILIIPEGGTLLNGYDNRIVFNIPNSQAVKGEQVGSIVDEHDNEVATVSFYSSCLGTAIFKPVKNMQYRLVMENKADYPLPIANENGYLLHVNNLDLNIARIRVISSSQVLNEKVKLIGTQNGIEYFEKELNFENGNILDVELSKNDLSKGILSLKLVDEIGTSLATRPILIEGERLHIGISPIPSDNDEAVYKIKVTDKTNAPVKTQLALSVNRYDSNNLLETGDFSVEHTDLFTYPNAWMANISAERKNRFVKDLGLLVSSAGHMNNPPEEASFGNEIKFPVQRGLELAGYAYDLDNKLLSNTNIQILAQAENEIWFQETITDANGLLRLEDIQINGNTKLVFRTKGKKTKSRLVKLKLLNQSYRKKSSSVAKATNKQKHKNIEETTVQQPFDTTGIIKLDEIQLLEERIKEHKSMPSVYGLDIPRTKIKFQDPKRPKTLPELLATIPGVVVSGIGTLDPSAYLFRSAGGGPVLWVIDGLPLQRPGSTQVMGGNYQTPLSEIISLIPYIAIERIEILVGSEAAIFGSRGSGGVIFIYTRSGGEIEFISRKEGELDFQGFEPIIDFNSYQQNLTKKEIDRSNILYWNPKVETDEKGEAIIRLPISASDLSIQIEASAITTDGKIGSISSVF